MAIIKLINDDGNSVFFKDLSIKEYELAKQKASTHDMEILLTKTDGLNIVKCNRCHMCCSSGSFSKILSLEGRVIYTTCDEYLIKDIIE